MHNKRVFFEMRGRDSPMLVHSRVREPRENRGRLRHCNGLQTSNSHWSTDREGGSEV